MIVLLFLVIIAVVLMWAAVRFLPEPIGWGAAAVILILCAIVVFGGGVDLDTGPR